MEEGIVKGGWDGQVHTAIFKMDNQPPSQADVDCPESQDVLAMKPACSLVDNASLGLRLPPSGSGCLSLEGVGLQLASSAQSFVV